MIAVGTCDLCVTDTGADEFITTDGAREAIFCLETIFTNGKQFAKAVCLPAEKPVRAGRVVATNRRTSPVLALAGQAICILLATASKLIGATNTVLHATKTMGTGSVFRACAGTQSLDANCLRLALVICFTGRAHLDQFTNPVIAAVIPGRAERIVVAGTATKPVNANAAGAIFANVAGCSDRNQGAKSCVGSAIIGVITWGVAIAAAGAIPIEAKVARAIFRPIASISDRV